MRFLHYQPYTVAVNGVQSKMVKKSHHKIIEIMAGKGLLIHTLATAISSLLWIIR